MPSKHDPVASLADILENLERIESLLGDWDAIGIDFSTVGVARARRMLGPLAEKVCEGDFFTYP